MIWILQDPGGVEIKASPVPPNGFTNIVRLARMVVMTFVQVDENGAVSGDPHVYTEPYVNDVSDAAIARLIRDQQTQLNRINATQIGVVKDLSALKALVAPTPIGPTEDEQAAIDKQNQILSAVQTLKQIQAAVSLGLVKAGGDEQIAAQDAVKAAIADDQAGVLAVIGA